ncbi:MAG: lipoyl(octanoyl) transferase LipB [Sphingomicrobium sp.]
MDDLSDIEWKVSPGLTPYQDALEAMEQRAAAVRAGEARELVWLLEHPPLFTAGTSAAAAELTNPIGLPVFEAGRGGRYTYHGPGQRVGYLVLDLEQRGKDIRRFVHSLEQWMIDALARCGVEAHRSPGRIGIWVGTDKDEAKIGALGVRVKRWVTLHGFSLNVDPDLGHFTGIVPCGISDYGVASLASLGKSGSMADLDNALKQCFGEFLAVLQASCKES